MRLHHGGDHTAAADHTAIVKVPVDIIEGLSTAQAVQKAKPMSFEGVQAGSAAKSSRVRGARVARSSPLRAPSTHPKPSCSRALSGAEMAQPSANPSSSRVRVRKGGEIIISAGEFTR